MNDCIFNYMKKNKNKNKFNLYLPVNTLTIGFVFL